MNRKFLSVVLSTLITATSCFSPLFSTTVGAVSEETVKSEAVTTQVTTEESDPVTLNFYSYTRDYSRTDVHLGYKMDQKTTIKANRGDDIMLNLYIKSTDEPYTSSLSLRYDLKEEDNIEEVFGVGGEMEVPLGKTKAEYVGKFIPKRDTSLLEYVCNDYPYDGIQFNPVIQEKIEAFWDDGDIFYDDGAFELNEQYPHFDFFGLVFQEAAANYEEFQQMREEMHFTESEGGDLYCSIPFHVSEDTSLGDEQTVVAYFPELSGYDYSVYQVTEMTMDVTGSTYEEPVTEPPTATEPTTPTATEPATEEATAIIHFADDNEREPLTVKVGDTFTYDIYLKMTDPEVQSFVTWTFYNQPVGTKKIPNQAGNVQIPEEDQVLKVGRGGYTPYYSPYNQQEDLMNLENYLIAFGMGSMNEDLSYNMLETDNGTFTQEGGCLISTITFTVQKAGEVEIFTQLEDAVVDLDNGEIHSEYVAVYNEDITEDPTTPTATDPTTPTEAGTAIIHFADDNEREPITVNVGDTFTYDIYLKMTDPEVQSYVTWTFFNQPVGTKQTANQIGDVQIPEENQVLKVGRGGYTPYYSPYREDYDLMVFSNYLISFGMGSMNEDQSYNMLETDNGTFTQEGGCLISSITFTVQKAGEVEIFTQLEDAVVDLDNGEIHSEYVAIYNEKVTEEPTESATAIIHFADDNEREPLTVNVGDTFTYDIYLKMTDPEVQSYVTWTFFNQPVGTKQTANQIGDVQIPEENQVLKVGRGGYTPHYSPYQEDYDLMIYPNYLISFGMGSMNEDLSYNMLETDNGTFTQEGGCLISTITFTVQKAGEVEVFTRLDDAVVDLDNGEIHSEYVAIYNEKVTEDPTTPTTPTSTDPTTPTEAGTAIIHFADDNEREPITVNVGDTFTYDIYLKMTDPEVQSYVTWTFFNQPVGTKQTPNQIGDVQIPEENQVLKVGRGGYTPYYSPYREDYDLMVFSNYLISFGMGSMNEDLSYNMLETDNGSFTQEGGCLISSITFTVQKAGEVEIFTQLEDAVVDLDNGEIHSEYVAIYNEKVTEEPTEPATAIIHFVDDNEREPITARVGDTITYDIYLRMTDPEVQSYVTWTFFNQSVGTKQTANQIGDVQIPEENQVLKVGRGGYTPYYSPYKEDYDLMIYPNYLISFGMGSMNEDLSYNMLETDNGTFTQEGGCLISSITFTVQKAGEVEVFTRLDDAVVDLDNGEIHSEYVAIYNNVTKDEIVLIADVSGDDKVTLVDLTYMSRYALNPETIPDDKRLVKALDVNQDGKFTLVDVTMLSRHLIGVKSEGSYADQWMK